MKTAASRTWVFDLGNTRLKLAPTLDAAQLGAVRAIAHGGQAQAFAAADLPKGDVALLASVADPALTVALLEQLSRHFTRIALARTQRRCGELRIAYAEPARLGVDRFLAMLAAHRQADGGPVLVVGVGTALTIDLVDAAGLHRGGRIAPAPALMRSALQARAKQLPEAGGTYAEFADDTADALASGCEGAAIALVERSLAQASTLLGRAPRLLVHGGGSDVLLPHLPTARPAPGLVLEGLAQWAAAGA